MFSTCILKTPHYVPENYIVRLLLGWIKEERNGNSVNSGVLKTLVTMLADLDNDPIIPVEGLTYSSTALTGSIYKLGFEHSLLKETEIYYSEKRQVFLLNNGAVEYLKMVALFWLNV